MSKAIDAIRARLAAMEKREIGGADARVFYQWDIAKLLRALEVADAALDHYSKLEDWKLLPEPARQARAEISRILEEK